MVAAIIKAKNKDGMANTPISILIFVDNRDLSLFNFIGNHFHHKKPTLTLFTTIYKAIRDNYLTLVLPSPKK
ncbi:MAG: hypothetical protein ACI95X_002022 [Paraglaciecola sp.]|jgi:hypothetical protein